MFTRLRIAAGLTLLAAFAFVPNVLGGGWAVITLDVIPAQIVAGEPLEIGFVVRQHGVTPMSGLTPVINARLSGLNKPVTVMASEAGVPGHYTATLTLPQAGEWEWAIQAFTVNQPMPALRVVAPPRAVERPAPVSVPPPRLPILVTLAGALAVLAGLVAVFRRRSRWAFALIVAGITFGSVGFASAASRLQPQPEVDTAAPASEPVISQVEMGRELFVAKGCMVCHSHVETNPIREFGTEIGPDLSRLTASPEYLRLWLKNPAAAKSTATMPNLGLSETEIEALIAFLNAK